MTELRLARPQDALACAWLLQDWLEATPWMPQLHSRAETEVWMASRLFPASEVWVLEDGDIRGFLALQARREVAQLVVAPAARRQGGGQRLLEVAKAHAPGGLGLWCFVANEAARRFYAREGFVERGGTAGENAESLPDLWLEWGRP